MKSHSVLLLLLFNSIFGFAQWSQIFETGTVFGLQDISAANDLVAWATMTTDSAYRTVDGGASWDRIGLPDFEINYQINHIYALNEDVAFLCGFVIYSGVGPGIIYRTNDGGATWTNVLEIDSNCTFSIYMKNSLEGIVIVFKTIFTGSSSCSILKTSDGGITWSYDGVEEPTDYFVFDNDQLFGKGNELWISDSYGNLHYSSDLGNTWDEIFSATFSNSISIPVFENNTYGIVGGTVAYTNRLLRTTDGETFDDLTGTLVQNVENIVLQDEEIWYTINPADDITVYYSSDSGETFEPQFAPLNGIKEMTPSNNGIDIWALNFTGGGKIYKYENPSIEIGSVNFSTTDPSICPNSCISFTDLSTNFPIAWNWYFEGAITSISTDQNPSEICYESSGSFDVILITTNAEGINDTLILSDYIFIYPEPIAPSVYQFYDAVVCFGGITFQWFQDGIILPDEDEYIHEITENGFYTVGITDINGCKSEGSVEAIVNGIHFIASDDSVCTGELIHFEDASEFIPTAFSWSFEGGEPLTSTEASPDVVYNSPGIYSVSLFINFETGYDSTWVENLIYVFDLPDIPTITISGNVLTSSEAISYQWYFNGELIIGANSQIYEGLEDGNYTVLTTDENGCTSEQTVSFTYTNAIQNIQSFAEIFPNPVIDFLNFKSSVNEKYEIRIYNQISELVYLKQFNQNIEIDLTNFLDAIYFVKINSKNTHYYQNIIKMK